MGVIWSSFYRRDYGGRRAYPNAVDVASDGSVYIADTKNCRVFVQFSATLGIVCAAGCSGSCGGSGDGGPAVTAKLREVWGVGLDEPRSRLLIADTGSNRIRMVNLNSGIIGTLAGNGNAASTGDGGSALAASFNQPGSVVAAVDGTLFISEMEGHVVRRVSPGGVVSTVAGTGARGFNPDAAPGLASPLNSPWHLTLATSGALAGSLLICDRNNGAIRSLSLASGILSTLAGNGGTRSFTPDGNLAAGSGFTRVLGLAVDDDSVVYFSDSGYDSDNNGCNNCVRAVGPDGLLRTVAGLCTSAESSSLQDGMQATSTALDQPYGLALAPGSRRLYIADHGHAAVRIVTLEAPPTSSQTRSASRSASRSQSRTPTRSPSRRSAQPLARDNKKPRPSR